MCYVGEVFQSFSDVVFPTMVEPLSALLMMRLWSASNWPFIHVRSVPKTSHVGVPRLRLLIHLCVMICGRYIFQCKLSFVCLVNQA